MYLQTRDLQPLFSQVSQKVARFLEIESLFFEKLKIYISKNNKEGNFGFNANVEI